MSSSPTTRGSMSASLRQDDSTGFSWSNWKGPIVAVVLAFLCNIESSMLSSGEWPYMSTIDHDATSNFYGTANSVNKAAHVLCTFIFAGWSYRISSIKIPMVVGRCITLVGCIMYIFVEFIPSGRRWWMLVCYMLFGVGFGTSPLLRSYVVRVTSDENRASAFAMLNGAGVLSVMVGPIAQLAFADLPYPGIDIIPPNIKLNIYSAPIWVAVITNIVAILISVFLLQDAPAVEEKQSDKSFSFSLAAIRELYSKLRGLNIPWILVALIFVEKMVSGLFNATMPSVVGPLMTSMYAFDGQEIIIILGVSQVLVGLLAVAFTVGFVLLKLGNRVSCRVLFAFSNIMMITGYVITYPYPFDSMPMQPFNETSRIGCDREEYAWCDTQLVVNIVPFIIVMIIVSAFAIPSAMMSLDTIYSKIIGNIDQNMMQSFIVIADDAISIIGPIYGSAIFTAMGLNFLSIFNGCIYIIGTILWFSAWRWLKPYH
ncbi:hypothetical protein PRIPAC_81211 [Pristionchus pacificus]|nr:hypothetical protein PRIPAC_81211 [Pristionchus pacificus]